MARGRFAGATLRGLEYLAACQIVASTQVRRWRARKTRALPLRVMRDTEKMELLVRSGDRAGYQRKGTLQ